MTTSIRRGAAACALLATTALASPALANSPLFRNLDANGVDLVQGDFLTSFSEGSIGSGEAKLELLRLLGNLGSTGLSGNSQWDRILLTRNSAGVFIDWGARTDQFPGAEPRGATLSGSGGSYVYTAPDGTQVEFSDPNAGNSDVTNFCDASGAQSSCILVPTSIASPDGKVVTLGYEFWIMCPKQQNLDDPLVCTYTPRLSLVSNSFGYSVGFSYASGPAHLSRTNPPATFSQRTGAAFYNSAVSSSAQSSISYAYPSSGVTDITDTGGRVWRITSTTTNYAIRRPGASANTTSATVSAGIVSSVTKEGVTTSYSRSVVGTTATETATDPLSHATVVVSDLNVGRPGSVTDPNGHATSYLYDSSARLTWVTQPEGNYVAYTYDSRGNVTQTQSVPKSGSPLAAITTSASYDATCANPVTCNAPNTATDERGNVTDYTYDPTHGGVTSVMAPAPTTGAVRPETRYSYTLLSGEYRLTGTSACQTTSSCAGTADEVKSSLSYDGNGNLTGVTSGDGAGALAATSTMTYDAVGNLLTVDGPLAGTADTTRYRYDSARELIGTVSPDPDGAGALKNRAVRNSYTNGLLTKVETGTVNSQSDADWAAFSALQTLDTSYDANARPTVSQLSAGGTAYSLTQASYDALGRTDCVAQRMNPAAFGSLPASACSLGTAGSYGNDRIAKAGYDAAGQVTQVQSAYGTSDVSTEAAATYTSNGLVQTATDAMNNKTTYVYDGFDRLSRTQYPASTQSSGTSNGSDYEQLTYDAAGNVTQRRLRDASSIGYSYDALNRTTAKDLPGSELDVTYAYDLLGRITSAATSAQTLSFAYDALGRNLTQGGPLDTLTYHYDAAGRRTQVNGSASYFVGYTYLVTGEVASLVNGSGDPVATFGYDDLGRRTATSRCCYGAVTSYGYDGASRLTSLGQDLPGTTYDQSFTFSYNPAGQIASRTASNDAYAWNGHYNVSRGYSANGLNQYSAAGAVTPSYDSRGNLTSAGAAGYGYSSENRLTSSSAGAALSYDPLGRLYRVANGMSDRRFLYDGGQIIGEYDGAGAVTNYYLFGAPSAGSGQAGADEPLLWFDIQAGTFGTWAADERGSVIAAVNSAGTVTGINSYDEYGIPASGNIGRFQYTGQAWLPELGMYYYKARIYSPTLGRFLQTDPIGYGDGMNWYNYVGGDPVNLLDPTGLDGGPGLLVTHLRDAPSSGTSGVDTLASAANLSQRMPFVDDSQIGSPNPADCQSDKCAIVVTGTKLAQLPPWFEPFLPHFLPQLPGMPGDIECACFEAGTLVATPTGLKAIENIGVGDLVLSEDERTGKVAAKKVTSLIRPAPKSVYELAVRDTAGKVETFYATGDHRWKVDPQGWTETAKIGINDRIETGSKADVTVISVSLTNRIERTYNLVVAEWHTFMVGRDHVVVHNGGPCGPSPTVKDILKTRKGSILRAPLPPGSPSWDSIMNLTLDDIAARRSQPGYNTIWKLLTDGRFAR